MPTLQSTFNQSVAEYIKPIIKDIDSVYLVPPEEIKSNEERYPQGNYHREQKYLTIVPADGEDEVDLTRLYEEIPPSLTNNLFHLLYTDSKTDSLLVVVGPRKDILDTVEEKVELHTPTVEGFREILARIQEDITTINPSAEEYFQILGVNEDKATIKVHTNMLLDSSNYGVDEFSKLSTYITDDSIVCTKIVDNEDEYYILEVQPSSYDKLLEERESSISEALSCSTLTCTECGSESVTVSVTTHILHCKSCKETLSSLGRRQTFPTERRIEALRDGWWDEINSDTESVSRLDKDKMISLHSGSVDVYLAELVTLIGETAVLYAELGENNFLVSFNPQTKDVYTVSENMNEHRICYNCCERVGDSDTVRVSHLGIPNSNDMFLTGMAPFCKTCIDMYESQLAEIVEENPEINAELLGNKL